MSRLLEIFISSFTKILIPGLLITIPLTIASFAIGFVIALITAMVQIADIRVLRKLARFYVWIIRGTPLLVQLYVVFYGLPHLGILIAPIPAAIIVFSLSVGAYDSETLRSAIDSISTGQIEAGYAVGMSYGQIMFRIVLPQALRIAFPPLFNSLIGLVKDTSLAANITVAEMFMTAQRIVARTYEPFILYIEVALIYLIFCTVLTRVQAYGERKLSSYGGD